MAWLALGLGISARLTVNVLSGLAYGVVGAVVSAWLAVALILSYELLMIIVRRSASAARGRSAQGIVSTRVMRPGSPPRG